MRLVSLGRSRSASKSCARTRHGVSRMERKRVDVHGVSST